MNKFIQCTHFSLCSGCSLNEYVDSPPVLKEAERYFKAKGVPLHLCAGKAAGWRYRAKLAVRGSSSYPCIGLYREGSHQVVDIPFCKVHHPAINQAAGVLRRLICELDIQPYDESTAKGDLRYVQVVVERSSGKVQLSLVWNGPEGTKGTRFVQQLWDAAPEFWHSIWINRNTRRDNVIFGDQWIHRKGEEDLWETFGSVEVCFHPASFAQANLDLYEQMLHKIKQEVSGEDHLLEYYAGVGVIGLSLVGTCGQIRCVEVVPDAEKCFEKSRRKLPLLLAGHISFHLGSADQMIHLLEGAKIVIVDPPRKGVHAALLKAITEHTGIDKLIYVSCGWPAFLRDCETLLSKGWNIKYAEGYVFFPGSNHLEILCVFTK